MKRSQTDSLIDDAIEFLDAMNFKLPPWAFWTPARWRNAGPECEEIRRCRLGWDITDFGSGDFQRRGLLLFTLRNGLPGEGVKGKGYAEKAMLVQPGQETPAHFHWRKTEDIINRGGGALLMTLGLARQRKDGSLEFPDGSFGVQVDGVSRSFKPGETLRLAPGESVCLEPFVWHSFQAEGAACLAGEVSSANDDASDNRFLEPCGRFPSIEEDAEARHLLCTEISL